ncbi:energy transducer TonB [Spirosoma knui]
MDRITFENEKEIRLKSFAGALTINVLLVLVLLFVHLSQTIPNPPPIQFVEVNFGTDARGSGKIQTYNKASDSPNPVDVKPSENRPNPKENTTPRLERTRATPTPKVEDAKPAKTSTEKPIITSKAESPVTTPERPEPKRVEAPKPTAPVERTAPPVPAKKVETVNNDALFKKSSGGGGSNGTVGKASGTGGNNNGDDADGVGDKGNPNGKIDAKSLYGTPGGASSGVAFDVSGWSLASRPNVNDDSDETGRIVFRITVDGDGEIVRVQQQQSTVSPSVAEVYRKAVQRLRLRPKGGATPPTSTGTITFIIKARD